MFSFMSNVDRSGRKKRDRKARPGLECLELRQVLSTTAASTLPIAAIASTDVATVPVRLDFGDLTIEKNGANFGKAVLSWYVEFSYDKHLVRVGNQMTSYGDWEHIPIQGPYTFNAKAEQGNIIRIKAHVEHVKGRTGEDVTPELTYSYDAATRTFKIDGNPDIKHEGYAEFHQENGNLRAKLNTNLEILNNDDFANAQALSDAQGHSGPTASVVGSNIGATGQAGEKDHANNSGKLNSVWYTWTAPANGNVTIDTFGSSFDTTLAVYTGPAVDRLTLADPLLSDNDDDPKGTSNRSRVTFAVKADTHYWIAVDGHGADTGKIALNLAMRPANDDFANAQVLNGTTVTADGSNIRATSQERETNHAKVSGSNITSGDMNSVWYTWTAPASGNVTIDTVGSLFDTTLAVYTGSAVERLTLADPLRSYNDDDPRNSNIRQSTVTFAVKANTTYRIAVAGYKGATGDFHLNIKMS